MKKQTVIAIILIGGFILSGLSFTYGYLLGQKQIEEKMAKVSPLPRSTLITNWQTGISGEVTVVTTQSITISSAEESITLAFSEKTKVKKIIVVEGKLIETIENLTSQEVQEGNIVFVSVIADIQGNLRADTVTIQETR